MGYIEMIALAVTRSRDMTEDASFLIIRTPDPSRRAPVVVSIPHFGMQTLPGIDAGHFAKPEYVTFPLGYVDRFAAEIYGDTHRCGATVLATPYSRLFVDVNRRRDDFREDDGVVTSPRGVVRTHHVSDGALFAESMTPQSVEHRLRRYYDPYHTSLHDILDELAGRHERGLLVDAHTASERGLGGVDVVVGTARGRTAREPVTEWAMAVFRDAGFRTARDVKGYSGGHIVRTHGRSRGGCIDALQIEVNTSVLMTTTRRAIFEALTRGETPPIHEQAAERLRNCIRTIIRGFGAVQS